MEDTIVMLTTAEKDGKISHETAANVAAWLQNHQLASFHQEIAQLVTSEDWQALNDAFYTQIEFGTAGMRGKTGLGSARINEWTIGIAVQGLADYVKQVGKPEKGVVIGSDTRLTSPQFVKLAADILTSNGISVYKFERPPQVGMFSFAVRLKQAQAGVYISASHNPPSDNGFKCYWEDGCQLLAPHDKGLAESVAKVTQITKENPDKSLMTMIGDDFDSVYRSRILQESVYNGRSAQLVYSPFHGTGQYGVLPILQEAGFEVITVDEQMAPDGNFPNVPGGVPNPQNRESNQLTAAKVLETGADLGISTDPDADRLGLVVRKGDETVILDGNQTANLLTYFICHQLKEAGKLPTTGFLVRTLVTTPLMDAIAEDFGLKIYNNLPVGFKYIGEVIGQHEDFGDEFFIYGAEESFGSLKGSYARDKDASSPALIAAEMISWLKDQGKTVWDLFDELTAKYGDYHNDLLDLKFEGAEGFATMTKLMASVRTNPPKELGPLKVVQLVDRKTNEITDMNGTVVGKVDGHTANIVQFILDEDGKNVITVRPSGTEPKVKLYIALCNQSPEIITQVAEALQRLAQERTAS